VSIPYQSSTLSEAEFVIAQQSASSHSQTLNTTALSAAVLPRVPISAGNIIQRNAMLRLWICGLRINYSLLDVRRQRIKCLVNIDIGLGRDLHEGYSKLIRQSLSLLLGHNTLLFPITFVTDEDLVDAFCSVLLHVCEPSPDIYIPVR
jgi:hypothetical protein